MKGFEVLIAALALLVVPVVATSRSHLEPRSLSLLGVMSTVLATFMVLSTLAVCAGAAIQDQLLPSAAGADRFSLKHLIPGLPGAGWLSLAVLGAALVAAAQSLIATSRRRRRLRESLAYADIRLIDDVPVATVATDEFLAIAIPGGQKCVIISRGARQSLSDAELRAVLRHEEAHLSLGHHRHLLLARALDKSMWFVPGMHRALGSLKASLELAADAIACETVARSDVRGAVVTAHSHGNSSAAAQRTHAIDTTPTSVFALVGAWVIFTAISASALSLMLSWLGIGL